MVKYYEVGCGMWDVGCGMWEVKWRGSGLVGKTQNDSYRWEQPCKQGFYALPPLTTRGCPPTQFGFITMLFKILEEYNPDYISVAFDRRKLPFAITILQLQGPEEGYAGGPGGADAGSKGPFWTLWI